MYLIGASDAKAEEDAANNEHPNAGSKGVEECAGKEEDSAPKHGDSPAQNPSYGGGSNGGDEGRQVERRREERQRLAVVFAVLIVGWLHCGFLGVHGREEFLQE